MACYSPLEGYRSRTLNPSGKRGIVFSKEEGYLDLPVKVPCGQCIGCRLERSRQWAMRCVHEASLYEDNCFITLTYDEKKVPGNGGLVKDDFQRFIKRFRKRIHPCKIRYYHCGEYGEEGLRPHYHAIIFNYDFKDRVLFGRSSDGSRIDCSNTLSNLWNMGFTTVGDVTFESAAYVARYVLKKVTGKRAESDEKVFGFSPYHRIDMITGELYSVEPEYTTMSRRPGIGKDWIDKYKDEVYQTDSVIVKGKEVNPPKYYDQFCDRIEEVKQKRRKKGKKYEVNNTRERLGIRETVQRARMDFLKRTL